jgi:hypothetical protein
MPVSKAAEDRKEKGREAEETKNRTERKTKWQEQLGHGTKGE